MNIEVKQFKQFLLLKDSCSDKLLTRFILELHKERVRRLEVRTNDSYF